MPKLPPIKNRTPARKSRAARAAELGQADNEKLSPESSVNELAGSPVVAPKKVTVTAPALGRCPCTCGQQLQTSKSRFRQGHDQRWASVAANDLVRGGTGLNLVKPDRIRDDMHDLITAAADEVTVRYSAALAAKFESMAHRAWANLEKTTRRSAEKVARDASREAPVAPTPEDIEPEPEGYVTGATIRVKVGRWERAAFVHGMNQAGKVTAVRYTDASGNEKVTERFTVLED